MNELTQKHKLIATYARVSTSNQENEGTIETQILAVNEFAKKHGHAIVQNYVDNGWSGDNLVRPDLDRLRMDAKKKHWEAVLIYDPDRLARRGAWQELVIEELKELGIEVLFVTVPPPKTDEDVIMNKMRGVFNEYERMKIKERFRIGKVRKATEGNIIASEAPYGYTFIPKKGKKGDSGFLQGHYEINEIESQIIKSIFSWVANEGLTLRGVVKKLQGLGIAPRKSKRGVWSTSTLSTLLRNKTYIGEGHYGASYAVVPLNPIKNDTYKKVKKTSRKIKPEEEWIKIKTLSLINEDLFNRTQKRLKENFEASSRNTKNQYLLSHKIWCQCGCRRAGEGPQKGKYLYYRCTSRVKSFPLSSECEEKGLNSRIVDKLVWQKMSNLMSSPELIKKQLERWVKNKSEGNASTINIEQTKKEVASLKSQEDRYVKAYGSGVISVDQLKEFTVPLKEKVLILNDQLAKAQSETSYPKGAEMPKLAQIEEFASVAKVTLANLSFEAKQGIIKALVDKIVGTRLELQINGYIPITQNINDCTLNRHCRTSKRWKIDTL